MVNYANGKIYMIESASADLRYYGSTCNLLRVRFSEHRRKKKQYEQHHKGNDIMSFYVLEYSDAKIFLVEEYPCKNRAELTAREGWYIRNNKCVNKIIPGRTQKEWREDNKESLLIKKREYYYQNKDMLAEKERVVMDCLCGKTCTRHHRTRHYRSKKHITWQTQDEPNEMYVV